jgi:glycosyltransferase involved in cell wall biosynthesis
MKRRMLIFFPSWGLGGSTLYLGQYIKAFASQGHDIVSALVRHDRGERFVRELGSKTICIKYSMALSFTSAPSHNRVSIKILITDLIKFIHGLLSTSKLLNKVQPEVVLCGEYSLISCILVSYFKRKKLVVFIQSSISDKPIKRYIVHRLLALTDRIITISELHNTSLQLSHKNHNIIHNIVYNQYDSQVLKIPNIARLKAKKTITFVGGFSPIKGTKKFIEIVNALNTNGMDVNYLLIGPGNIVRDSFSEIISPAPSLYAEEVYTMVKDFRLTGKIIFTGETNQVLRYLQYSNILISCNNYPHFMRPVIEAWSQRIPVIVYDDIYGNYLVQHKVNGIIANDDIESWSKNIQRLLDDENHARQIGLMGYKKYLSDFSEQYFMTALKNIKEVIN